MIFHTKKYHQNVRSAALNLILWAVLPLVMIACERESSAGLMKLTTLDSANQYSLNPVIQFVDSSAMRAQISAGWAKVYDRAKRKYLGGGLKVEFFTKTGLPASNLTADSAVIEDDTKNMIARGNVVVTSQWTQTTVKTTELIWDESKKLLRSDKFVDIASPNELIQGYGFESDANLEHYTIFKVIGQTLLAGGEQYDGSSTAATQTIIQPLSQTTNASPAAFPTKTTTKSHLSTNSTFQR